MADMGTSLTGGFLEVQAAGTAERLTSTGQTFAARSVIVQALENNEESVAVGGSGVKAKKEAHGSTKVNGVVLTPSQSISFDIADPAQIFVDARKNKDGVSWVALLA